MAELVGYPQLQARLRAIDPAQIDRPLLGMVANIIVREQKLLAARFRKTGNLEHGVVIASLSATGVIIESKAAYSGFVEGGTGLYGPLHQKITPKAAKALRWIGGGSSRVRLTGSSRTSKGGSLGMAVFARSVKGRPATPYFFPGARAGLAKSGGDAILTIVEAWNRAA